MSNLGIKPVQGPTWNQVVKGALVPLFFVLVYGLVVALCFKDLTKQGQFGDMFGALNCLFTGVAFVGLMLNVHLQRRQVLMQASQLEMQREELDSQKEELKEARALQVAQRDHLAEQARMLHRQAFESTLFTLIQQHSKTVDRIVCAPKLSISHHSDREARGAEGLKLFCSALLIISNAHGSSWDNDQVAAQARGCLLGLEGLLRSLATIYAMIAEVQDEKRGAFYVKVLLSSLSDEEERVLMLYYNDGVVTTPSERAHLSGLQAAIIASRK